MNCLDEKRLFRQDAHGLNCSDAYPERVCQRSISYSSASRVDSGTTCTHSIHRPTEHVGQRKRGGGGIGQEVDVESGASDVVVLERTLRKLSDELPATCAWQVCSNARDQRRAQDAHPQQVGQARAFATSIEE